MSNPKGINQYTKGGLGKKEAAIKVTKLRNKAPLRIMSATTGYTTTMTRGETASRLRGLRNEQKRLKGKKLSTSQVDANINNIRHAIKKERLGH